MEAELSLIGKVTLWFTGVPFVLVLIFGGDIISAIGFAFMGACLGFMIMNIVCAIGILLFK